MHPTKLVIAINSSWNFINFRSGLIQALVADGWEVVAVGPNDGYARAIEDLGCRFVPITLDRRNTAITGEFLVFWQFYNILQRERPDALLTYTIKPNIYGSIAARILGIPTLPNVAGLGTTFLTSGLLNRTIRLLYRAALSRSPVVFFQNEEDRDLFARDAIVAREASRLLPGSGIDLNRFRPPATSDDLQSAGGPTFLMIARLLWAKGVSEYHAAAQIVRAKFPKATFRLIGMEERSSGGVDLKVLQDWHEAGDIVFDGPSSDVRSAIAEADCIVLPSYYPEGTPRVLLESAAMGRPLITTDMPGCRTVVDDGRNGYIVPPRDVSALSEAMCTFARLDDGERRAMGRASRAVAEERFDEQIVIRAYLEELTSLMDAA